MNGLQRLRHTLVLAVAALSLFSATSLTAQEVLTNESLVALKKAGLSPKEILRTKEDIYRELGLAKKDLSDDEWLEVLIAHPDLIQRPIVEKGEKVILARPGQSSCFSIFMLGTSRTISSMSLGAMVTPVVSG